MENEKGYELYLLFAELGKETTKKFNLPETISYDDA